MGSDRDSEMSGRSISLSRLACKDLESNSTGTVLNRMKNTISACFSWIKNNYLGWVYLITCLFPLSGCIFLYYQLSKVVLSIYRKILNIQTDSVICTGQRKDSPFRNILYRSFQILEKCQSNFNPLEKIIIAEDIPNPELELDPEPEKISGLELDPEPEKISELELEGGIGGVPFYVNRGSLPVDEETWERMWRRVARIHPNGEALAKEIRGATDLPKISVPSVPTYQPTNTIPQRLEAIQKYICKLQYNHTGTQFFEIKKSRPLTGLMDIAKEMTREALPIKCLEAVILAIHLTNNMPGVERFPLSFKSHFSGNHFYHVVLGIHSGGRFGALGMSRREDLMFKPLAFRTLLDLVQDFEGAYRANWHTLRKIKIGQYVSHDPHSVEQIEWKHSVLDVDKLSKEELRKALKRHTRDMRLKIGKVAPPSPVKDRRNSVGSPHKGPNSPIRRISRVERRSPSGEKKALEQKSADINEYQIRV